MMIFHPFRIGTILSLCMKIINSVVVVGLYYGFLTIFSIGPSYLLLLQARVMEEGTQKEVAATTGFITGQLMILLSIYYAPLYLALARPHTVTVIVLPYFLFQFFWNNHKYFFDYTTNTKNSMRNLTIQFVFLNNIIFQLFNHFLLPSPTLARLVNIYIFRYNNKILFVTSSFLGWLIGHIFFMKWVGWVVFWIRQNPSIIAMPRIGRRHARSNKYLVADLRTSMGRILSILLFITCAYNLGGIPSPIFTKKLKENSKKKKEMGESEEETDVEIETTSDSEEIQVDEEEKTKEKFEKPIVTLLFDYKRWNRPLRYITTNQPANAVRNENEMAQYFFATCLSDGKQRISFTYPPSLSTFFEMIQKRWFLDTTETRSSEELYNRWVSTNEQKRKSLSNEFIKRIEALDKGSLDDVLEKRTRLYNDGTEQNCLPKVYDPFLSGPHRGTIRNFDLDSSINNPLNNLIEDSLTSMWNKLKLQDILPNDFREFEDQEDKKSEDQQQKEYQYQSALSAFEDEDKEYQSAFEDEDKEYQSAFEDEDRENRSEFAGEPRPNTALNLNENDEIENLEIAIENFEIEKKVPRWSYKLNVDWGDLENEPKDNEEEENQAYDIWSPEVRRVVIYTEKETENETENETEKEMETGANARTIEKNTKTTTDEDKTDKTAENARTIENPKTTTDEDKTDKTAENIKTPTEEDKTAKNARTIENPKNTSKDKEDKKEEEEPEEIALLSYLEEPDFDRDLIKGSMRAQRRKMPIFTLFHPYVRSPLFLGKENRNFFSFDILEMQSLLFRIRNLVCKCVEFKTFHSHSQDTEEKKKKRLEQAEQKDPTEEVEEKKVADFFELYEAQRLRGVLLVTLSFLRKYIILPSLIIAKNIGRMLLFQCPEWHEDWKAWSKEMHVKCTYEGIPLSENEFPQNWLDDGIQIKILFPFDLKPWHKPQVESNHKDPMKKKGKRVKKKGKGKKGNFCFLTPFGMEAEGPFGPYRKKPSFFKPIWKEIDTNRKKTKKEGFLVLRILKQRTKGFRKVLKKQIRWIFKIIGFIKRKIQELRKVNTIPVSEWGESSINRNRQNDNDIVSNKIITESLDQVRSRDWINDSLTSKQINDLADSTNAIKDQMKTIITETRKKFLIPDPDIEMSPKNPSYDDKKLEPQKGILQIFKRRNTRLIRKWHYFVKFFIERIYIEIPLYIINSMRIHVKVFLESNKNTFVKYSHKDEPNQKKMRFISTIRESLSISNSSNNNEYSFCDLASLSQAYVFYKLSQTQIINKYHWKSVLQYQGTLLFLKDKIKDSFRRQGISHSKSGHKKIHNMRINEWKNWLRGRYHYQYNLSKPQWSRLVAQTQKWRNRIQKSSMVQTKNSQNVDFDKQKKDLLIHYENEKNKNYAKAPVLNKKLKNYKYDRLSHKYLHLHYEDKKGSDISRSPLQVNEGNELLFNYKYKKYSLELYDLSEDVVGTGSLKKREDYDRHRNRERKYFDWRIFDFSLKTKMEDIEFWLDLDSEVNILKNIKKRNIYPKIDKEDKKDKKKTFPLAIDKQLNVANRTKNIFDWMGMNEERIKMDPISKTSTLKLSFLPPEFVSLYDTYKIQPWSIPINSLLFNFDGDENAIEKKDSKLEIENKKKKEENKKSVQGNIGSDGSNQQKDLKEDSNKNDKQPKKKKASELDLLLKKNYVFQAKLDEPSPSYSNNVLYDNIKVISLLVRLQNPTEITLISIKREDLRVEIIPLTNTQPIAELVKKGYLFIEPAKLSIKWDGQSIMYQTITILHVLKNKQKMKSYQKSQEKRNVDKKGFYKLIPRHKKLVGNRDKNHNDLLVIENILSPRRRRELRIRLCLNSGDGNVVDKDRAFCKGNKASTSNCLQVLDKGKSFDINANQFMKFKFFLWPNYRLEDLACMNRYWFDTNNGSRFSMSRIRMYPQLRIT